MSRERRPLRLRFRLVVTAFILLAVLPGFLRPIGRVAACTHKQPGSSQLVLLSESATDVDPPFALPMRVDVRVFVPVLVGTFLVVLRTRRIAFIPIPVRRLKRPARTTSRSLPSNQPGHSVTR